MLQIVQGSFAPAMPIVDSSLFGKCRHDASNDTKLTININIQCPGGNWDPTDRKFSSVNSYRQDLLPTCKAFPKENRHTHLIHTKS